MCGIAGFVGEDHGKIDRMVRALMHRGPDGHATVLTHGASLGHARLAILDPRPVGDQPMWNDDKTAVIVFNGEIFNYRELKDRYDFQCKTGTDTEVLLRLYDRYGMDFVRELRGMFAFALYDTQKGIWHLARDPSGIKPLFISYPHGKLHFASEMRALMTALPMKPALNMRALSQYLRLQYVPGPQTLCQGIESLPPGTVMEWSQGNEKRNVIQPDVPAFSFTSRRECMTGLSPLMDEVVKDHLVSDKPVGIFLSGGMDSSIVLHHMQNYARKPINTFTVRFEATKDEDEARFNRDAVLAAMTAKHYGTDHHEIVLTADICRSVYVDSACAMDQPNADSVAMAQFVLAHEAKKEVDVVLCGAGGDELFGGYPRYRIARILHAMRMVPTGTRRFAASVFGYPPDVLAMDPSATLAERLLARPVDEIGAIAKGNWFDAQATTAFFGDSFQRFATIDDPVRSFMELDRATWLVDESLRLNDAMTMASGLECRVPFLDPRLIAFSLATPSEWHVGLKRTKTLLKDAYRSLLPDHLYTLPKASFYPPLAKWIRRECAPLVETMLASKHIQEFFDIDRLHQLFDAHRKRQSYHLHILSTLTQLSYWFETVYDVSSRI